jgi:hypothetical protein
LRDDLYAKIPTQLFYEIVKDEIVNKITCVKDTSILTNIRDSKVVLILYQLYLNTNYKDKCNISISHLINECGYYNNDKSKSQFKTILNDLCKLKYITTELDLNKLKHNNLLPLDTTKLIETDSFVILKQQELDKITSSSTSNKEILNLLKVYLYLKCKCNKKKDGHTTYVNGGKAQVAYPSYENIAEFTYTSESHIVEYITKLKDLGLIEYRNLGKKYHENDPKKRITECTNIYAITSIVQGEYLEIELKEGLKQQEEFYKSQGYIIVKDNNINDKSIYGRKGYLTKKLNNETITDKELKELELINTNIEKYRTKYNTKSKKKKI